MSKVRPKVLESGELSYVTQKGPIFFFFFCQKLTHYALQILKSTTSKEKDKYSIRPLWKDDKPILPYNRNMTISRMLSLERKFEKQLSLKSKYVETINENKEKWHARKLPNKAKLKSSITSHTKSWLTYPSQEKFELSLMLEEDKKIHLWMRSYTKYLTY